MRLVEDFSALAQHNLTFRKLKLVQDQNPIRGVLDHRATRPRFRTEEIALLG
jgi:hypothetical protein